MTTPESATLLQQASPKTDTSRADAALQVRVDAAIFQFQRSIPLPEHPNNGDEARYPSRFASYSKGLPHDGLGDVDTVEYDKMLAAIASGLPADFEAITLGGSRKLINPQSAYAFQLEGADSHSLAVGPAPAFATLEASGEMEELYWMALARDVSFLDYAASSPPALITDILQRLNQLGVYRGPRVNGQVTAGTLFRDTLPGSAVGPFISQFLLQDVPYGTQTLSQRIRTRVAGDDRVFTFSEWLSIQNGQPPAQPETLDPAPRYLRNARDLAEYVHHDFPMQSSLNAALILTAQNDTDKDGKSSPPVHDENNPYRQYLKQEAFATFGNADGQDLLARIMKLALQGVWFQKWEVHRRLRPEEFGGRVHNTKTNARTYPVNAELLGSPVLQQMFDRNKALNGGTGGTYLLAQAFPEGSPVHPAYASGHSTYVGAGVTMVKAFFKTDLPVLNPVVPSADGLSLVAYTGPALTIENELDKLAMNIGIGRLMGGVHWRTDHENAVRLGELIALRVLQDLSRTYNEDFAGFRVRTFGGNVLTITCTGPQLPNHVSAVTGFSIVDGSGQPVPGYEQLSNGMLLRTSELPSGWRLQVNTFPARVGSVRLVSDGNTSYLNAAPYRLPGSGAVTTPGVHTLEATPYSGSDGSGLGGVPLFLRFQVESQWARTGTMQEDRRLLQAVLLSTGKVLACTTYSSSTSELYNPATGQWTLTGSTAHRRVGYAVATLANGKVLLAGGTMGHYNEPDTELYDPVAGTWSSAGALSAGRGNPTATVLNDGRVLLVGGLNENENAQVEVYDPASGWSVPQAQPQGGVLFGHTATLLNNGKVLVVGGRWVDPRTQLFDPDNNTWEMISTPGVALTWHTATLLLDGTVLVAGGSRSWLFDPATLSWSTSGNLVVSHSEHTATRLANGKVLVVGGRVNDTAVREAELYDPATRTWTLVSPMIDPRYGHAAVLLADGRVLIAGAEGGAPQNSCELFTLTP